MAVEEVTLFEDQIPDLQDPETEALFEELGLAGRSRHELILWARALLDEEDNAQNRITMAQVVLARTVEPADEPVVACWLFDVQMKADKLVTDFEFFAIAEASGIDINAPKGLIQDDLEV